MSFPVLSFPFECAILTGQGVRYLPITLCDMLRFMHREGFAWWEWNIECSGAMQKNIARV